MARPLRMYSKDGVYFVTARTHQARLLLRPSTQTNEIVGGVLARAAELYKVEVYGFVFASNHVHLLVRAVDGVLSRFMQHLLGNIARKVGKAIGWSGAFWERRFSVDHVLDDGAAIGRLRYILAHGVKEGLVETVADWPGLSCLAQLLGDPARTFRWFSWAKRWLKRALRADDGGPFSDRCAEKVTLVLQPLPAWKSLSRDARRQAVLSMVEDIEKEGCVTPVVSRRGATPRGRINVLRQHPHRRPVRAKREPRPHWACHATEPSLREEFVATYRAFVAFFREASRRFRRGEFSVEFPPLAFRPPAACVLNRAS